MSGTAGLSVNDVVNVSVTLQPKAVPLRNFGSFLIIGPTANVITTGERLRQYADINGVLADFANTTPEYFAAVLFFSQNPRPAILYIGKWAQAATSAALLGGVPVAANQVVSGWTGVTTGSMAITVDGVVKTLAALNFSGAASMNAVAGIIQTALSGSATCVWNANYRRFEIRSSTTGASSALTYATPTGSGVDISTKAGLSLAGGASAPVNGIIAETPIAALTALSIYGAWYGCEFAPVAVGDITDNQYIACAGLIEAMSPSRIMAITTQEAAALDPTQTSDLGSQLSALGYNRSFVQYSSNSIWAAGSAFARAFTVNFEANNTTITLKFKQEPGVIAEVLNETQANSLHTKHINVFVEYANGVAIVQEGVMASGAFFDTVHGTDWLQNRVQTDIFNTLFQSPTKIPQTDPGMHVLATVIENALAKGVDNGLIAPGVWNGPVIGNLQTGQYLSKGFYLYVPAVASQDQADRDQRIAVPMQAAIKLAGAVHSASVVITVNN
jgi:hypothetical protein